MRTMNRRAHLCRLLPVLLSALLANAAGAAAIDRPALCASDNVPAPSLLIERFINADCADCWRRPIDEAASDVRGALTIDWIAPGPSDEQGALFAAARVDALARLKALGLAMPSTSASRTESVVPIRPAVLLQLRVAHGLPVGDYIGTSIELQGAPPGNWRAWLLLVEELPAGSAGSPIARRLVRNSLQLDWTVPAASADVAATRFNELRPMQMPSGSQPERLAVVGLLEAIDPGREGVVPRLVALARSRCEGQ